MTARKVRKLPTELGPAGWDAILPAPTPGKSLEQSITTDWLVIGAGFAGLSAARRLTQLRPNDTITVIDAGRVAGASSGRNSGFMIDLPHDLSMEGYASADKVAEQKSWIQMSRSAISFAADTAEECGFSSEIFDICGKINAAATQNGLNRNAEFADHLKAMGEPYEMLDAKAMQECCGTPYYRGGVYSPGTAQLQPAAYIRGLADSLRDKIDLYEHTAALGFERAGNDWIVETPKGRITAGRVILAVNGYLESFGFFKRRLMHVFAFASMTRALGEREITQLGGARRWGVLPADPMGSTVRRISGEGGDRIVVRSRYIYDPTMEVSNRRVQKTGLLHDRLFEKRFPMLKGVEMEYRWAGRLCLSRNAMPAFGELEEGLFSACCDNGLGLSKGTFAGISAAELATGKASPLVHDLLRFERPSLLPPEPLSWIGANAVLRWGEWRAGGE